MILGYNTNGLAHHRLSDALELCARIGYRGVAITLDVGHLDPMGSWKAVAREIRAQSEDLGLSLVIETGSRFLLDATHKHQPSLLHHDPAMALRRVEFYLRSLDVGHVLGAKLLSLWSGSPFPGTPCSADAATERLIQGLVPVLERAEDLEMRVAFEPEPGMWIETPTQYLQLRSEAGAALERLGLTLDVGHCLVTGTERPEDAIHTYREHLLHVHLDDIRNGVHEHCMFGQGDLDLPAVLAALQHIQFKGMAAVELSRDSYRGAEAAQEAHRRLQQAS